MSLEKYSECAIVDHMYLPMLTQSRDNIQYRFTGREWEREKVIGIHEKC